MDRFLQLQLHELVLVGFQQPRQDFARVSIFCLLYGIHCLLEHDVFGRKFGRKGGIFLGHSMSLAQPVLSDKYLCRYCYDFLKVRGCHCLGIFSKKRGEFLPF